MYNFGTTNCVVFFDKPMMLKLGGVTEARWDIK